jgi:hypothetical protein
LSWCDPPNGRDSMCAGIPPQPGWTSPAYGRTPIE